MSVSRFVSSEWFNALTLAERIICLSGDDRRRPPSLSVNESGRRRLERWRQQPPFDIDSIFAQRLQLEDIDTQMFLAVLSTSPDHLHAYSPTSPPWLTKLGEAFAQPARMVVEPPPGEEMLGFLELIQPLLDQACDHLAEGIGVLAETFPMLPFNPATIEDVLLMNLPDPLLMRLGRTMVLELNVARLQGHLAGNSPAERFRSFIDRLRDPNTAIEILAEYPVLARQLALSVDLWIEVCLEFLGRLCADWACIREQFCGDQETGLLVELTGGVGDTHRRGRSVMIAEFDSGFRLVYKPKSLAVDAHFQELILWLNRRGCSPPLHTLSVLNRGDYGWVEYVEYQGCDTPDAIRRFYLRLGAYLALLYAINASDFHLENLIAAGEYPMLIDLETLFNPEFERMDGRRADEAAAQAMMASVLSVGMLPQRLWSADDYAGIDISGLGGEAGQLSPDRLLQPAEIGTDAMHYVRTRVEMPGEANRPTLDGIEVSAVERTDDVVAGFTDMFRLLIAHRDDLLANGGPLECFEQDEIRVLLRPTRTYDQLLFESFHPDMLRDGLARDRLFDRLWMVVPERAYMARVIAAEGADLRQGDIPIFTTFPRSLSLWSSRGDVIAGVLTEAGMTLARRRIRDLSVEDLARQVWFIRSSLATLSPSVAGLDRPSSPRYRLMETAMPANRGQFLAAARSVADRLASSAILGEEDVSWLGLEPIADKSWDIGPLAMDLYGGVPGIALFLAYVGDLAGELRYTNLARRCLKAILDYLSLFRDSAPEIGGFEGWGGILYVLTHLGALWEDLEIFAQADTVVDLIASYAGEDESFGVVGGAAGAIAALLAFRRYAQSRDQRLGKEHAQKALAAAFACGDHLIESAQPMEKGIGWTTARFGNKALAGFAHGAAGIAWALLELAAASGEPRYRSVALQAIDYERSLFSIEAGGWLDLRQSSSDDATAAAWCHGAGGIGLARLGGLSHLADPRLRAEIDAALESTLAHGFGRSHSLCHGDLGNVELLVKAGYVLGEPYWQMEADRLAAMVLASIERDGWQCGGPEAVEMPSLMQGLAGIGYGLLRLAAPEQIPSVLLLEPPHQRSMITVT